ncbi:hypothetical protein IAD21_00428 [Abditibacteriota bacterium]|nr:hypothetical protein IAD21_00428 [Abditibacteriota bacterium]
MTETTQSNATEFDVAVIGAGLAGSCAAILLAQGGASVVLLDASTPGHHKVCGEFLSPESRTQLAQLGVMEALGQLGVQSVSVARVSTSTRQGRPINLPGEGIAISRATLDALLWRRAHELGVQTRDQHRVSAIERAPDGSFVLQTNQSSLSAHLVISAAGRSSRWGRDADANSTPKPGERFVGIKTHMRGAHIGRGEVVLFPFEGGYCGLVEIEDEQFNVCLLAPYARLKNKAPRDLWEELRRENRALGEATEGAHQLFDWIATANVSFDRFAPIHDGILRIGDAAGYIHPLSGDGMAMALRSGELAARSLQDALKWHLCPNEAARNYARMWQREFGHRLKWASALHPLLTNVRLSNAVLRLVDALPLLSHVAAIHTRGKQ